MVHIAFPGDGIPQLKPGNMEEWILQESWTSGQVVFQHDNPWSTIDDDCVRQKLSADFKAPGGVGNAIEATRRSEDLFRDASTKFNSAMSKLLHV